jgi:hypothetical protein
MKPAARFADTPCIAGIGALALVLSAASARAQPQPPSDRCRPASKIEYNAAKAQFLLTNRFGFYQRTGHVWRRFYWYCRY